MFLPFSPLQATRDGVNTKAFKATELKQQYRPHGRSIRLSAVTPKPPAFSRSVSSQYVGCTHPYSPRQCPGKRRPKTQRRPRQRGSTPGSSMLGATSPRNCIRLSAIAQGQNKSPFISIAEKPAMSDDTQSPADYSTYGCNCCAEIYDEDNLSECAR